jgi:acetyl esterase/lipase
VSFKIPVLAASLLGVAALAGPVAAQVVAADVVAGDNFPRMPVSFPNEVTAMPDLVYSTIPGFQPLKLDLYAPARRSASRGLPLVIYVHGGAWMGGHSRAAGAFADFPGVLASLSARGYVVASLNYRLSGEARFPAALHDVRAALRYLRANAARFGIDPRRVFLWGASAGGQLASLAATTCGMTTIDPSWGARSGGSTRRQ